MSIVVFGRASLTATKWAVTLQTAMDLSGSTAGLYEHVLQAQLALQGILLHQVPPSQCQPRTLRS